jgi:hypothetical protein
VTGIRFEPANIRRSRNVAVSLMRGHARGDPGQSLRQVPPSGARRARQGRASGDAMRRDHGARVDGRGLNKRQLCVARSEGKGHVTVPKGGRLRYVPLTKRLTEALRQARHLRGVRVLCDQLGQSLTQKVVQVRREISTQFADFRRKVGGGGGSRNLFSRKR